MSWAENQRGVHPKFKYLYHPQICAISTGIIGAKAAKLKGKRVLDCFCGTGTLLYAAAFVGASKIIGGDIEDYTEYLHKEVKSRALSSLNDDHVLEIIYNKPAHEIIKECDFDILFTDPPNPRCILGNSNIRVPRDIGMTGNKIKKMWEDKISPDNLMGKGEITIKYVNNVFRESLLMEKKVFVNMFESKGFNYLNYIEGDMMAISLNARNWFEIRPRCL